MEMETIEKMGGEVGCQGGSEKLGSERGVMTEIRGGGGSGPNRLKYKYSNIQRNSRALVPYW